MAQVPRYEEWVKKSAEQIVFEAMDGITVYGRTLREWADKIAKGEYMPVHHGYLIQPYPGSKSLERCSVCGEEVMQLHNDYCGNCGAILDGGADNGNG